MICGQNIIIQAVLASLQSHFVKKTFTHLKVSWFYSFLGRSEEEADGDDGEGEKTKRTGELSDDVKS